MISSHIMLLLLPFLISLIAPRSKALALEPSFGVQDSLLDRFLAINSSSNFTCLGADVQIMGYQVNDDYCDCPDGSDEPGTSACSIHELRVKPPPEWMFRCKNDGFNPQNVPHNYVNDGICDCCDGSDEYFRIEHCPNVCAEMQEAESKRRLEEELQRQASIHAREKMVKKAQEHREHLATRLPEEKSELKEKEKLLEEATMRLSKLEEEEIVERQRQKEANNIDPEASREGNQEEEKNQKENPNIRCLAWHTTKACGAEDVEEDHEKDCDEFIYSDEAGYCECLDTVSDTKVVYEKECDHATVQCSYVCANNGEDGESPGEDSLHINNESEFEIPEAKNLRGEIDELRARIQELSASVEEMESQLKRGFNIEDVLRTLNDECFSTERGSQTYELCPFRDAHQYRKGTNIGSNIGRWGRFGESTYSLWASRDDYTHMLFEDGDYCWNGVARSTTVRVICGPENKLLEVDEPSVCKYTMVFQTPAVCE